MIAVLMFEERLGLGIVEHRLVAAQVTGQSLNIY
jgi:hypothetical protein